MQTAFSAVRNQCELQLYLYAIIPIIQRMSFFLHNIFSLSFKSRRLEYRMKNRVYRRFMNSEGGKGEICILFVTLHRLFAGRRSPEETLVTRYVDLPELPGPRLSIRLSSREQPASAFRLSDFD